MPACLKLVGGAVTANCCFPVHGQVRESGLPAIFVFVAPPSVEELEKRLRGRGTETEEAVQKRLTAAKAEIARCSIIALHDAEALLGYSANMLAAAVCVQ